MGLSFREKLLITGAVNTLLCAIQDDKVLGSILAPLAKLVAVGTVALESIGYEAPLNAAIEKAQRGRQAPPLEPAVLYPAPAPETETKPRGK